MKKIIVAKKAQTTAHMIMFIGALLMSAFIAWALLASAGIQFGFLGMGGKGDTIVVGVGTGGETGFAVLANIGSAKPIFRNLEDAKTGDATYATAIGNFRGQGDEIAALGNNYRIKTVLDPKYTIVDDFSTDFLKNSCKISKMRATNIRGGKDYEDDLFILANCKSIVELELYRVSDIRDYGNSASRFSVAVGQVTEGHAVFGDFDADGKEDLAYAAYFKPDDPKYSPIQRVRIFYKFDASKNSFEEWKDVIEEKNIRITALVAGNFTGSKYDDLAYFTENQELWMLQDPLRLSKDSPDAKKVADGFDVDDNALTTYNQFQVKKHQIVVGDFKGDAKDEIVIATVEPIGSLLVRNSIFLLSRLDTDNPEKEEAKIEGLTGETPLPIVSLSAGRFGK